MALTVSEQDRPLKIEIGIETLLEQAEEAALRREQFIAMLSHELRNPLAAILNATTLIDQSVDPAVAIHCNAVITRQAKHMQRLLDDLTDVSRITRGRFELRSERLDLRAPIESAIESTGPLFFERGVRLEATVPDEPMALRGDPSRLTQVFVNLLSNAANYSPRHSVVKLIATTEGGRAVIRVLDHGVGIESELQEKIFDLFVQSEQRLDRSRGGLGVGLSLARSIVELHGGKISVQSGGPGKGSDFTVAIPLDALASPEPDARSAIREAARCRIVIVDDQDDLREMLRMLLESRDHTVFDAADGPSAIELILRERPDVAFIDIGLPMMNGYEVARRIRQHTELAGIRLIALTGFGAPSDVLAARAAGFDDHLIKPAELSQIEAVLRNRKPTLVD